MASQDIDKKAGDIAAGMAEAHADAAPSGTLQLKYELPAESPVATTILMVCFGVFSGMSFALFTLPYTLLFTSFYIVCAAIWCAPFCYDMDAEGILVSRYGRSHRLLWKDFSYFTETRGCLILWSEERKAGIRKRPRVLRFGSLCEKAGTFAERHLRRG